MIQKGEGRRGGRGEREGGKGRKGALRAGVKGVPWVQRWGGEVGAGHLRRRQCALGCTLN